MLVSFAVVSLAVLALSLTTINVAASNEQRAQKEHVSALYVAEAGLGDAYASLVSGGTGDVGSSDAPVAFGNSSYWVTRTTNADQTISLVSTGTEDREQSRVELTLSAVSDSIYRWAAFGELGVVMASNSQVDSYNSALGTYASQAVNGSGSNAYALTNGNVGSNADITVKQNAMVEGVAQPGPGSTTTVLGNATVSGSTTPATTPQILPPLDVPSFPSTGAFTVANNATSNLPSGNYQWTDAGIGTGGTLNITGPATIVCDSLRLQSGSQITVDASNGPVEFYVITDFVMGSNTHIYPTSYKPADLRLFLESDNIIDPDLVVDLDQIDFNSNAYMYGTIYAPQAKITINSNFQLYGALIARDLVLDSNSQIHFDEALADVNAGGQVNYTRVCFRVLAAP